MTAKSMTKTEKAILTTLATVLDLALALKAIGAGIFMTIELYERLMAPTAAGLAAWVALAVLLTAAFTLGFALADRAFDMARN